MTGTKRTVLVLLALPAFVWLHMLGWTLYVIGNNKVKKR